MMILVGTRRRLAKAAALWFSYSTKAYLRGLERSLGDGYRITLVTPSVRASISTYKEVVKITLIKCTIHGSGPYPKGGR